MSKRDLIPEKVTPQHFPEASLEEPRTDITFFPHEKNRSYIANADSSGLLSIIESQPNLHGRVLHELWRTARYKELSEVGLCYPLVDLPPWGQIILDIEILTDVAQRALFAGEDMELVRHFLTETIIAGRMDVSEGQNFHDLFTWHDRMIKTFFEPSLEFLLNEILSEASHPRTFPRPLPYSWGEILHISPTTNYPGRPRSRKERTLYF